MRVRRHYLDIAKAAPPGDGNPKEPQRRAEKREVVNFAGLVSAAREGGIYCFGGKCVQSGGEKNVAIEFPPGSGTGEESRCRQGNQGHPPTKIHQIPPRPIYSELVIYIPPG